MEGGRRVEEPGGEDAEGCNVYTLYITTTYIGFPISDAKLNYDDGMFSCV